VKQQSQILFLLLVAATIAVDGVAIIWLVQAGSMSRAGYLFDALATGQTAVVCVWAAFSTTRKWLSLLAVVIAVSVWAALDVWATQLSPAESFGIYAGLAAALLGSLWIFRRSTFWHRRSGQPRIAWQFSIIQVMGAMTILAVLITSLRGSELLFGKVDVWRFLLLLTICDVLIVISTLVVWSMPQHWLIRAASACAIAGMLGTVLTGAGATGMLGENVVASFESDFVPNSTYTIVTSLVVFVWLELGLIVAIDRRAEPSPPAGDATV
jgi:hypothetical protein